MPVIERARAAGHVTSFDLLALERLWTELGSKLERLVDDHEKRAVLRALHGIGASHHGP